MPYLGLYNTFMEIAKIAEAVSKHKIIGLGESTHGTHEFFSFKSELFRRLVTKHGFNTLLFEDSQEPCRLVNDYISGKDISLTSVCNELYSVWQTEELKQLLVWLKNHQSLARVAFTGFDIDQAKCSDLSLRDELMAKNIKAYCDANSNTKAVVWAHNSHIQLIGSNIQPRPMGYFLKELFGQQYIAVALLFGKGSVSATRLKNYDMLSLDRSLSVIKVESPPSDLAESIFETSTDIPIFITQDQIRNVNIPSKIRSIGWGLVPESVNEVVEETNLKQAFDYIVYFPKGTHSHPLPH